MRQTLHKMATKPLLLAVCLGITLLMTTLARAQGRAPAVLPELGLSIEERKQIPPQEAREFGFNFKEKKNQPTASAVPSAAVLPNGGGTGQNHRSVSWHR